MPGGRTQPGGDRLPLTGSPAEQAEDIRAFEEAGITELMLSLPWRDLNGMIEHLRHFMREVAPRV
jgi:hypothetical protein